MQLAVSVTPPDNDVLWARGLVTTPRGRAALRGVSVGVRQGEVLAVTGVRGAGKTTLLDCLAAVRPVDSGEIWFNSAPVHTLSRAGRERLRRERFGHIGSEPQLVPELTARENVALPGLLGGAAGGRRRAALRAADDWLERLDIADFAHRRARQLRPEQQQRVAVARALAHSPTVVLADDPTAPVVERAAREQLMRMLVTAVRSHGLTLLLATTDHDLAAAYADRTAEMTEGRLAPPRAAVAAAPAGPAVPVAPVAHRETRAARAARTARELRESLTRQPERRPEQPAGAATGLAPRHLPAAGAGRPVGRGPLTSAPKALRGELAAATAEPEGSGEMSGESKCC